MRNIVKSGIKIALLTTTVLCSSLSFAEQRINNVIVKGNQRVESSTIENYLGLKKGDGYSEEAQAKAIKALYSTALFENIQLNFDNGNLIVTVQEPAFISKVEYKGNTKIKNDILNKELLTIAGTSLSKGKTQADVQKIKELYKRIGRFSASVEPTLEQLENNRVKVVFNISEGPKTAIKYIYFIGNENYKDSELKSLILTKESRWFRFLESNDTFDPDRIDYDKELLKSFYQSVGFADVRIISATSELSSTKEYFTTTYSIEEGPKYDFGKVSIENKLPDIDVAELKKFLTIKQGKVFNNSELDNIAENISNYLSNKGYPQITVYPNTNLNRYNRTVDTVFVIDKADKIFINSINISGNQKTHDHVIRRELKISEGDLFNRSRLEKSERNLRNLDYFEKVSTSIQPTDKFNKYDVNINVEEKSTAAISFDVAYNSASGPFARVSFLERNLIGTGKTLNFGVQGGRKNINYFFGITEPYFMDKDLSLGLNLFKNHSGKNKGFLQGEQNYSLDTSGGDLGLGYNIIDDLSHSIDYTLKQDNLKANAQDNSRFVVEQAGKFITSSLGHSLVYDQTDSRIVPKNGYIITGSQEYAGVGGDNKYLKHELDAKYFYSFMKNKFTLKISGSAGDIMAPGNRTVRISDRFNLGDYTLRGFASGGIGPRDKNKDADGVPRGSGGEGLGGQHFYNLSAELNFPLGFPQEFNLSGAVFADMGSVWGVKLKKGSTYTKDDFYNDKSIRSSVGFGFIWITRFAPIRVDWGFPVKKKSYDNKQRFHMRFSAHL